MSECGPTVYSSGMAGVRGVGRFFAYAEASSRVGGCLGGVHAPILLRRGLLEERKCEGA